MKFYQIDREFLENRKKVFSTLKKEPSYFVDQIGLFLGHVALGNLLSRYEIVKKTLDVPGHILEFGIFEGSNLLYMAKLLKLLSPYNLKRVYGFDSFKGLTEFTQEDSQAKKNKGKYRGSKSYLQQFIDLHKLNEDISLIPGYIEKTLPEFLKAHQHHLYSLIYIDVDLYKPSKKIFDLIWEYVSVGGVIALDEGYCDGYPGEGIAAKQFLKKITGQYQLESSTYARQPMYWIVKIK